MSRALLIFLVAIVLVLLGGAVYLSLWDPPAPTGRVERPVADDRLGK